MRWKIFVYAVLVFIVVLAGAGSFAADTQKFGFYVPEYNEPLYGTWVNTEYYRDDKVHAWPQKIVFYEWGYAEQYPGSLKAFALIKISKNGSVMEFIYGKPFPPEPELIPSRMTYHLYYKK